LDGIGGAVPERVRASDSDWNIDGTVQTVHRNSTPFLGERTLDFVTESKDLDDDQPWFAYMGFSAPHLPAIVPPGYEDVSVPPLLRSPAMNERDVRDKPWWVRDKPYRSTSRIENSRVPMLRSLVPVDDQIDRLLILLEDLGELNDTLVVFTSDNGFLWGEHHLKGKGVPYMSSVMVPFLVRWPGHVAAGRSDASLVGLLDLAPTILTAAKAPFPHEMDGIDFLGDVMRRRLPLEFWGSEEWIPSWRGAVARAWVYVEYLREDGRVRAREYYDLQDDPHQLSNVLGDGNDRNDPDLARLRHLVRRMSECVAQDCVI